LPTPGTNAQKQVRTAFGLGALAGCVATVLVVLLVWPRNPDVSSVATGADLGSIPELAPTRSVESAPVVTDTASPTEVHEPTPADPGGEPSDAPPLSNAAPAGEGDLPDHTPVSCPTATVSVTEPEALTTALASAAPGDVIGLADGTYEGQFVAQASGTEDEPIWLCGSSRAVLDGGDLEDGYVFHLDGASHWRLVGFTVTNGQKGVMADTTVGSVIQGLTVTRIGDEAVHLRNNSTDNVVASNSISHTGLRRDDYGEGVYIGSAVSNWCSYSACLPDRSDRNVVKANTITHVTSEGVDVKEGTTGGVVLDNVFDGSAMTGADSWVDIKGNNYLVAGNSGTNAPEDGFQTHQILPGWGDYNVFSANEATVNGPGYGIASWPEESNVVTCDNVVTRAREGRSNIDCT
jgi:hypothetical protein